MCVCVCVCVYMFKLITWPQVMLHKYLYKRWPTKEYNFKLLKNVYKGVAIADKKNAGTYKDTILHHLYYVCNH